MPAAEQVQTLSPEYLRACEAIPEYSPAFGSTDINQLTARFGDLREKGGEEPEKNLSQDEMKEYLAVHHVLQVDYFEKVELKKIVKPNGYLYNRLISAYSPLKEYKWGRHLRSCRRIPPSSPVHGCTSFGRINERRGELLSKSFANTAQTQELEELEILKGIFGSSGPMAVARFIDQRKFRRAMNSLHDLKQALAI